MRRMKMMMITGRMPGMVMCHTSCSLEAPSIRAAS